jgi:hypothetical protein
VLQEGYVAQPYSDLRTLHDIYRECGLRFLANAIHWDRHMLDTIFKKKSKPADERVLKELKKVEGFRYSP